MKAILLVICIIALYGLAMWYIFYRIAAFNVRKTAIRIAGKNLKQYITNKQLFNKFVKDVEKECGKMPAYITFFFPASWIVKLCHGLAGTSPSLRSMIGENAGVAAFIFVGLLVLIGVCTIDLLVILGIAILAKFMVIGIGLILFGLAVILICAEMIFIRSTAFANKIEFFAISLAIILFVISWLLTRFVLKWNF